MKIENYRSVNKGSVVASFDLEVPKWGVKITNMTLFQKDGKKWVSFPSKPYEKDGVKKYASYLYFLNKDHMKPFTEKVLEALSEIVQESKNINNSIDEEGVPF